MSEHKKQKKRLSRRISRLAYDLNRLLKEAQEQGHKPYLKIDTLCDGRLAIDASLYFPSSAKSESATS